MLETTGRGINPGVAAATLSFLALGAMLLGAAAMPPARIPWPVAAEWLYFRRSDLAAIGMGVLGLSLLCALLF